MGTRIISEVGLLCMLLLLLTTISQSDTTPEQPALYLVRVRSNPKQTEQEAIYAQRTLLAETLGGEQLVNGSLIYSYTKAFDGFAAKLTLAEVDKLSKMKGVLSVIPNVIFNTTTTNSWRFLGVDSLTSPNPGALWNQAEYRQDVFGQNLSALWILHKGLFLLDGKEHVSEESSLHTPIAIGKKLIGARHYSAGNPNIRFKKEYNSARDYQGHGTHTASTAGGAFAAADWNGYADGTAQGVAPRSRIAVYKVCWYLAGCSGVDVVAAMEDAIADGVDLMSISISGLSDAPFYQDTVGIASFHARKKGILVNFAAGNRGPELKTTNHNEPWSFTVAATSQDRLLGAYVHIKTIRGSGRGLRFKGTAFTHFPTLTAPLVLASEASIWGNNSAAYCSDSFTLDSIKISGKIVFCLKGTARESIFDKSENVRLAGGAGVIIGDTKGLANYTLQLSPVNYTIPAAYLTAQDTQLFIDYVKECDLDVCVFRDQHVQATIYTGKTFLQVQPAPVMAWFSSSGPSGVTTNILKPDIAAPGLDIVAAWINGESEFLAISGTSVATQHVAGTVALMKAIHPNGVQLLSTKTLDNQNHRITNLFDRPASPFSTGSGLLNPVAAADPGLIYDAGPLDYTLFLCSLGYGDTEVEIITGEINFCSTQKHIPSPSDLNYPSVSVGNLIRPKTISHAQLPTWEKLSVSTMLQWKLPTV
ncbi:hypothetical protein R1flu_001554 [Riccia fluitans]|uniref:Uncharacterized protein n=1 Tax=Riccia fluitans TaxID=41844 RepID=A0ABD1Y7K5_9MARC